MQNLSHIYIYIYIYLQLTTYFILESQTSLKQKMQTFLIAKYKNDRKNLKNVASSTKKLMATNVTNSSSDGGGRRI